VTIFVPPPDLRKIETAFQSSRARTAGAGVFSTGDPVPPRV